MGFTFTDSELHKLAQKPFSFENWNAFEEAFSKHSEFPVCYKLAIFEPGTVYILSAPLKMMLDLLNRGLEGDALAIERVLNLVKAAASRRGMVSIYEFIEAFPGSILA